MSDRMSDEVGARPSDQALVNHAPAGHGPSGFDPSRWHPIESAPKDGTSILVYADIATVPVVHIAWYRSEEEWQESGQYCGGWDSLGDWLGWWSYTRNSVTQERLEDWAAPTHWMPLPDPPA